MGKKNDLVVGHVGFGLKNPVSAKISVAPLTISASTKSFPPIITCLIAECPNNKGHRCSKPSAINIGLDGKCGFGTEARKYLLATKRAMGDDLGTP